VLARLHAVATPLPAAKPYLRRLAQALTPPVRPGDFAQAMMDLGATICTPKQPACILCPLNHGCEARRRGNPDSFPRKLAKPVPALRRGAAFVVE
jgi:A/G-specific adenine glycosylase